MAILLMGVASSIQHFSVLQPFAIAGQVEDAGPCLRISCFISMSTLQNLAALCRSPAPGKFIAQQVWLW
jgi:hypothetical protein